jgi:hypothetical protein
MAFRHYGLSALQEVRGKRCPHVLGYSGRPAIVGTHGGDPEVQTYEALVMTPYFLGGVDRNPAKLGQARAHLEEIVEARRGEIADLAIAYGEDDPVIAAQGGLLDPAKAQHLGARLL